MTHVTMPLELLMQTAELVKMQLIQAESDIYMCYTYDRDGSPTRFRPNMKDEHARLTIVHDRLKAQVDELVSLMPTGTEWIDMTFVAPLNQGK